MTAGLVTVGGLEVIPPSALPDYRDEPRVSSRPSDPTTREEIGFPTQAFACLGRFRMSAGIVPAISPLVGEMGGSPEGGVRHPNPAWS